MAPSGWGAGGGRGCGRSGGVAGVEGVADFETEEDKLKRPCFEGYLKGFWWEVQILYQRSFRGEGEKFLVRYIGLEDEEEEWVSLVSLRLRARKTDDWDCGILRRGVDVSVAGVHHPRAEQLQPPSTMALYDAKIVSVAKSKHLLDCCCKFFIQFYAIKDDISLVDGVDRALLTNHPAKEVQISQLSVLQQPGSIALREILKAHVSTKAEDQRWSVDAYFLKETELKLVGIRGEDDTPRAVFQPDVSEEDLANPGGKPRTVKGHHFGSSKSLKFPHSEATIRQSTGWANAVQNRLKREVNEVEQLGMKSSQKNNLKYSDRGMKRKHGSVEEKEISDIEDHSPGVSQRFGRPKGMAAGGSRWQDQNVGRRLTRRGHETLHKGEEAIGPKRGRKLEMEESESSPDENVPESSADLIVDGDHNSERASTRDVFYTRGGREEGKLGKSQRYHEHRSRRHELHKVSERELSNKSRGTSKRGKSADIDWQDEDRYPGRYYNTQKAEKRSLPGKDSKLDKKLEEENSGRRRGRPRGSAVRNGKGYEWMEETSSPDMKDNLGRPKHSREPDYKRSGNPNANFESPNNVAAFGDNPGIETVREVSRRDKGKLPERTVPTRSGERPQKPSPVKPMTKQKELEKGDNDPGSAKTDIYLSSSSPNSEDPASELASQEIRKLRPRIPPGPKKSLSISGKSNKMKRDAEKEKGAKEKVTDRPPPLYMDLLANNSKEDDDSEKQRPSTEKKPDSGLRDTWCPFVEDVLSDDSDCNIVSEKEPLPRTLWSEYDERAPAVDTKQPLTLQDAEVHESDGDFDGIRCPHKLELKDDVGYVCVICGFIIEAIEEVVPQVEIPHRRPREAFLDEWDVDRFSPDGNQGATGYDEIKNMEVVNMLNASLPPHYAKQMHPHQRDGFEFLWRNLGYDAGGNLRTKKADRNAGCVLAHAPGTGKSFLIICFLKSYMDRFPTSQPLIVAPKIMLLRWQKEFARWKSDIKVFILNTALTYGKRLLQKHEEAGVVSLKSHQMNSREQVDNLRLAVLYEWKKERSVCLVSYNLFSALTEKEVSNRTNEGELVGKCLLESTGILILDEGHFPRNKDTRIRKALMKVKTNARILLSGTLFQNNFEELYNTYCLVRSGFPGEVISELGLSPDMSRNQPEEILAGDHPAMEEVTEAVERKARKLFVEEIGNNIMEGQLCKGSEVLHAANIALQKLRRLTANLVHHHTGEVLACLPGLRDFGILLKPTTLQRSLVEVLENRFQRPEEYLKREIAVSEVSIHPNLLSSLDFVRSDGLNSLGAGPRSDLSAIEKEPSNPQDGVKTKFVFDLLHSRSTNEKVLIFSQHMAPLEMLEEMFKQAFDWNKNKDILRLDGTMVMNDREAVIERFNDPSSQVQVLLASTKACGEGINLVGASRVVFLDVLWNPAVIKQAISRAFRLGQKKIVYVYRLIAIGTIEEKKYKKAIRKDWLSMSIFTPTAGEGDGEQYGQIEDGLVNPPESMSSKYQSRGEEVRAWEVDASTCEDGLLEKLLKKDKSETNSFMKVVEHGSQFHNRKTPCGPDTREWFLEDWDSKDLSRSPETREGEGPGVEDPNPEVLAQKLHQDYGEIGAFDAGAASGSDTDEEIL